MKNVCHTILCPVRIAEMWSETVPDEDDDEEGTMASRFTSNLLKFILPGFVAKDKNVRFRVSQLTTEMVTHMGPIK